MTIQDALTTADTMRPNRIDDEQKIMWLSQLDGQVWNDTIVNHALPDYIRDMLINQHLGYLLSRRLHIASLHMNLNLLM